MEKEKNTLFLSYCWSDGSTYADELERQLVDYFDVKRDKSQLNVNDDIDKFMRKIASCDYVVIILTENYVKSINCMREVSYLVGQQLEWQAKCMILVIDESIYEVERKLEILNYWDLAKKKSHEKVTCLDLWLKITTKERNYLDEICENIEDFLCDISRMKNPSQIAIVNELVRKAKRKDSEKVIPLVKTKEQDVKKLICNNKEISLLEISKKLQITKAFTQRLLGNLLDKGEIEKIGNGKYRAVGNNDIL